MLLKKYAKQQGFVTILVAVMIILLATVITFITARNVINDQHMFRNTYYTAKAQNLAQGGFFYGLAYLNNKFSTMTDNTILTNANDSQLPPNLSITYTYIGGNNKQIQIQSAGSVVEPSGTISTNTVKGIAKQLVDQTSVYPIFSVSNVTIQNSTVTNLESNTTIVSGGSVTLTKNAKTVLSTGVSSTPGNIQSDIQQYQTNAQLNQTELQQNILNNLIVDFDSPQIRTMRLPSSGSYSKNQSVKSLLDGVTNEIIYIDMGGAYTAAFDKNITVGAAGSPVTIAVNGNVSLSGATIHGNVYATGNVSISNKSAVNGLVFSLKAFDITNSILSGGVAAYSGVNMINAGQVTYNSVQLINSGGGAISYGLVPGSWSDF